jgi:hypothetical protein
MILLGIGLILMSFGIRLFQLLKFISNISKVCHIYDWKCVDEDPETRLLEILEEGYYEKCEWSAYNFMFLKGPSPLTMYFSFKPLGLEYFYEDDIINKVKNKVVKCV